MITDVRASKLYRLLRQALDAAAAQVLIPTPERAQRDAFALAAGEQMRLPSQFLEVRCPFSAADLTGEQRRE